MKGQNRTTGWINRTFLFVRIILKHDILIQLLHKDQFALVAFLRHHLWTHFPRQRVTHAIWNLSEPRNTYLDETHQLQIMPTKTG